MYRWLDRAAIWRGSQRIRPPNVEQVRQVKRLMKMLPLWLCFLTLSLVAASGSTFFIDEATSLAGDDLGPVLFLTNLLTCTSSVVSVISSYALNKIQKIYKLRNRQKMELWRIGIGMSLSVPCCIAAWANSAAAHRRHEKEEEGGSMRVYLLTPQFLLLGMMGGLSGEGLQHFYESQVLESLFRFGPPFGEFVMGVGKFLSILCILAFHRRPFRWFGDSLDDSRLDKYYIFLAVSSFVNVGIYCLVACWYAGDSFLVEDRDEEMGVIDQQLGTGGIATSQPVPRNRSLSRRTVSNPEQRDEEEVETGEKPLLPSESNKNSMYNNLARLRMVTMFLGLFSRAARRSSPA